MKRIGIFGCLLGIWMLASASVAQAQQIAYTIKPVNLRAGPGRDYPQVAVLPANYPVTVMGCVSGYLWCDVVADQQRGWVYAVNIRYPYQNSYVPVPNYGAVLGIAIIGFTLDDYWGHYYRNRPWYPERQRWAHRPRRPAARRNPPRPIQRPMQQRPVQQRPVQQRPVQQRPVQQRPGSQPYRAPGPGGRMERGAAPGGARVRENQGAPERKDTRSGPAPNRVKKAPEHGDRDSSDRR